MLQEAIDNTLFDNRRKSNEKQKVDVLIGSFSDVLKGKQGRSNQNLLE
jgi:DNA-directed RNA polymerase beta' subunit